MRKLLGVEELPLARRVLVTKFDALQTGRTAILHNLDQPGVTCGCLIAIYRTIYCDVLFY